MNSQLKVLQLKAKHQVYTLLSGHNLSKLYGEGYDFAELREYQMGDDIRKINWTISAKLGKPYIKELHANRELSVVAAAFMDGGMYFGTGNEKQKKLTEVATLLGYAAQGNADLFTGIAYMGETQAIGIPTKQLYHIEQFSKTLFDASLLQTNLDYPMAVGDLFKRLSKPSLLFVLADFMEPVDLSLLAQKHEVIAIVIRDKEEVFPQKHAEVTLHDPKSTNKLETYFSKKNQAQYRAKLLAHDYAQQVHFRRYGIRFVEIFSKEEVLGKLMKLFV